MMLKKRKKSFVVFLSIILSATFLLISNSEIAKASSGNSREVEKMLNEIIDLYGKENIIFEDGIYAYLGENINLDEITNNNLEVVSRDNQILKIENNTLIPLKEGTTFIVAKENNKYHISEVYVSDPNRNINYYMYSNTTDNSNLYMYSDTTDNSNLYMYSNTTDNNNVVMIDPGHGGSEPGSSGNGICEKDLNLKLALDVKAKLEKKGVKVVMTREKDEFVSLEDRSTLANTTAPSIFVSIHINAFDDSSVSGIESYYYKDIDKELTKSIQNKLINFTGAVDRGSKFGNLHVIRETNIPATLVECGFLSNPKEAKLMKSESYQNKLTDAITLGAYNLVNNTLKEFIGSVYVKALGRQADSNGFNYWYSVLSQQIVGGRYFLTNLLNENEFIGKNMSADEFIVSMYDIIASRKPDDAGFIYWKNRYLNLKETYTEKEARIEILNWMMNEAEFKGICEGMGIVF